MSTQLQQREASVTNAFELEIIQNQVHDLLGADSKQMGAFKTKMIQMSMNPMLKKCDPASIINCGLQALTLDLPLHAGQGYIVAYKGVAQLDVGYKGWSVLAKRSGYSVLADAVYHCDMFEYSGFGFNAEIGFEPNHQERKTADDKWVKANIKGVIVSIREDATKADTIKWVPADLLFKIVGMSPSAASDYSPHNNWTEQMMCAKAIKSVLSKMSIDVSKAATLNDAIQIVNTTESVAQSQPMGLPEYSQSRFDEMWPKWVEIVESGKRPAVTIITQLTNGYSLTEGQMKKVMSLTDHEPIEGEVESADAKLGDDKQKSKAATSDHSEQVTEADAEPEKEPTQYDDETFKTIYKGWHKLVESGSLLPDSILADTSHKLTETQIKSVEALVDAMPVDA